MTNKLFKLVLKSTWGYYKIEKNNVTQQSSYNLPKGFFDYLLEKKIIKKEGFRDENKEIYKLVEEYKFILEDTILKMIGKEYGDVKNIFLCELTKSGGSEETTTQKQLLSKKLYNSQKIKETEWFNKLYLNNIIGNTLIFNIDEEKKTLTLDLEWTSYDISYQKEDLEEENVVKTEPIEDKLNRKKLSYQKIIYGAPGTGKSHKIKIEAEEGFKINNIKRVTFYDGYTYGQFVGTYKPVPIKIKDGEEGKNDITYEYIPGPLMEQLVEAYKKPTEEFLFIIEEINRAKMDRVFGNIFQLLDRQSNGESEYSVALSEEQKKFLEKVLIEGVYEDTIEKQRGLYFPNNFYIWGTMNNADQGVYSMDSAFRRRWNFEYIGLDDNAIKFGEKDKNYYIKLYKEEDESIAKVKWDIFRKVLNDLLLEENIPEDRLIAPFFIKPINFDTDGTVAINSDLFLNFEVFESKILMYLFDEVLKHRGRGKIFNEELKSFSKLIKSSQQNKKIFNDEVYLKFAEYTKSEEE